MSTPPRLAVMSSLMGIVFGCTIVYIISRIITVQRQLHAMEYHIHRKSDEDALAHVNSKIDAVRHETQTLVSRLASQVTNVLQTDDLNDNAIDDDGVGGDANEGVPEQKCTEKHSTTPPLPSPLQQDGENKTDG